MSVPEAPRHVRAFLSSPRDVAEERQIARDALNALPHDPLLKGRITIDVVSHDDPAAPVPFPANLTPQQAIDRGIPSPADCDLIVVILWTRLGTPLATPRRADESQYLSGTEYEYELAWAAGRPILVFRRTEAAPADADPAQTQLVDRFFERFRDADGLWAGGYTEYRTIAEFTRLFPNVVRGMLPQLGAEELTRSYVAEVHRVSEYLLEHYVPLQARTRTRGDLREPRKSATRQPLQFRPKIFKVIQRGRTALSDESSEEHFHDVADAVLRCGGSAVILGEPGSGKTTALRRLMLSHAGNAARNPDAPLPVMVSLGGYDGRSDLLTVVRRQLHGAVIEVAEDEHEVLHAHRRLALKLETELARGHLALFFDGLNEMPRDFRATANDRLLAFRTDYPNNSFLFTCRKADYVQGLRLPEIHIQPLDDESIRSFIRRYLGDHADRLLDLLSQRDRAMWDLGRNPYMLQLLASLFEEQGTLPVNRAALFGEFHMWLMRREWLQQAGDWQVARDSSSGGASRLAPQLAKEWPAFAKLKADPELSGLGDWDDSERSAFMTQAGAASMALAGLAYAMTATGEHGTTVPEDFATNELSQALTVDEGVISIDVERLLHLAVSASLVERTPDGIRFRHQLLQEYFAALHLQTLVDDHPEIPDRIRFEAWDQVVLLLAGLGDRVTALVERLISLDPFFGARCAGVSPERVSADVAKRLVDRLGSYARDVHSPWRERAVEALSDTRSPFALTVLTELLHDASLHRPHIIRAVGRLGRPEGFEVLNADLGKTEGYLRVAAARALDDLGGEKIVDAILDRLEQGDEYLRESAAGPVLERHTTSSDIPRFMLLLSNEQSTLRWAALRVLSKLGARQAIPGIVPLLQAANPDYVRETAADALARLGAREAIPLLSDQLEDRSRNFQIRASAVWALTRLLSSEDSDRLLAWMNDANPYRRLLAFEAAGTLGIRDAIPILVDHCRTETVSRWLEKIAEALTSMNARDAVPALIGALQHCTNESAESAVFKALERLATTEHVPALFDALRGESRQPAARELPPRVRGIVRVLWAAWKPVDAPMLAACLRDEHPFVRCAAARIAARDAVVDLLPMLIERVRDSDLLVRREAVDAVTSLGVREGISALIEALRDEDDGVRALACRGLAQLQASEAVPSLIERLTDDSSYVGECAASGLVALQAQPAVTVLAASFPRHDNLAARTRLGVLCGLREPRAISCLLVLTMDEREPAWSTGSAQRLSNLPPGAVLDLLRPLLGHPDWWIRKFLVPFAEEQRRRAGLPRDTVTQPSPGRRLALETVVDTCRSALDLWPELESAWRFGAAALRRLGRPADAVDLLDMFPSGARLASSIAIERAECYALLGRTQDAIQLVRDLTMDESQAPHSSLLARCGSLMETLGLHEEAERLLTRAIDEAHPYGYFRYRAAFHLQQGSFDAAERDVARATELEQLRGSRDDGLAGVEPWHPDGELQSGQLALGRGRFAEALAAFERAGRREPEGRWEFGVALALEGLNRHTDAEAALQGALSRAELDEDLQSALLNVRLLARSYPDAHRIERLRTEIARRCRLDAPSR